ncbi:MAG: helix-turn-helix transcriptional regulator [Luteimonas sp.]
MPSIPCYETRHLAAEVLATHRHRHAYAALVIDGGYVEHSFDGPIECRPGTLLLHPAFHAHGNRFGRARTRVINIELRNSIDFAHSHAWQVFDLREAGEIFARCPDRLPSLLNRLELAAETRTVPAWQRAFVDALRDGDDAVAAIATRFGVSAAHASRALTKTYGMPPQALRREGRWRRALAALRNTDALAKIAVDSGFADQSHFARICRAHSGLPPAALRRQIKCVQDQQLRRVAEYA